MLCEVLPGKIHVETICEVLMNHPPDTLGQVLVVQFYFIVQQSFCLRPTTSNSISRLGLPCPVLYN